MTTSTRTLCWAGWWKAPTYEVMKGELDDEDSKDESDRAQR